MTGPATMLVLSIRYAIFPPTNNSTIHFTHLFRCQHDLVKNKNKSLHNVTPLGICDYHLQMFFPSFSLLLSKWSAASCEYELPYTELSRSFVQPVPSLSPIILIQISTRRFLWMKYLFITSAGAECLSFTMPVSGQCVHLFIGHKFY